MCLTSSRRLWTNWSVVTDLERHRTGCTNTASSILRALMLNKQATVCGYLKCSHEVWYLCSFIVFWARIAMLNSLGSVIYGYHTEYVLLKKFLVPALSPPCVGTFVIKFASRIFTGPVQKGYDARSFLLPMLPGWNLKYSTTALSILYLLTPRWQGFNSNNDVVYFLTSVWTNRALL